MHVQKSFDERDVGTLYLVSTPIGNLEDMTYRAVNVLKQVDEIAAEDTRHTKKLLTHFEIAAPLTSYHEHNKASAGKKLIDKLLAGRSIALVSDAGMPAISDPGSELVAEAIRARIPVVPVPGERCAYRTDRFRPFYNRFSFLRIFTAHTEKNARATGTAEPS